MRDEKKSDTDNSDSQTSLEFRKLGLKHRFALHLFHISAGLND